MRVERLGLKSRSRNASVQWVVSRLGAATNVTESTLDETRKMVSYTQAW